MTELEHFLRLKEKVLLKYQEHYPFFNGNWKSFSSQDILNLIDLIEKNCKQSISEKWVYTHLKPETNTKIPRRDMLNILCEFVGFSSWDEFIFERKNLDATGIGKPIKFKKYKLFTIGFFVLFLIASFIFYKNNETTKTIELKNEFTNEKVKSDEVKVFQVKNDVKEELTVKEGNIEINNDPKRKSKLIIQSPFYKSKTIDLNPLETTSTQAKKIELKPDDYAMMLKAFMLSDIKDWQTRKEQLNHILSDNLEVIVMLKNDLGAEYFDKEEFSQKLIIPTASIRKMKIIEIKKNDDDKFSLSELNRSKMIKHFLFIGLLFFSFTIEAQTKIGGSPIPERRVTLNEEFSIDVLNAYQENSKSKIEDLFSYFQMLTDINLDQQLKSQITKNIYSLYKNENELVIDFTSNNFEKIPLKQFIQKLSNSDTILFKVSDEVQYNSVEYNFWKTNYSVSITKAGITSRQKVIQKVYFEEKNKNFGSNNKFVYETYLGKME